jgi:hypothetical protein
VICSALDGPHQVRQVRAKCALRRGSPDGVTVDTGVGEEPIRLVELICRRGDSNPHELPHTPLKRARLPVPPLRLKIVNYAGVRSALKSTRSVFDDGVTQQLSFTSVLSGWRSASLSYLLPALAPAMHCWLLRAQPAKLLVQPREPLLRLVKAAASASKCFQE